MRNKWFSPFSPNLVLNSLFLYPHSIQSKSLLEPSGRCLLLRTLLNPQEKTKLINMGKIKGPKAHPITVQDGSHQYQKYKDKYKRKAHAHPKKEGYSKPFTDASRSKGGKERKGEKCTYFHKGFHPEYACM
jgi:hypothetical protein